MARRATIRRRKALAQEAERVIRARYAEFDLSLADIAEATGTSSRQIQRALREEADTEFRAVLLRVRVEAARRFLSRPKAGLSVRDTARRVGFRGPSGLGAAFRRVYGQPPSAFQPESPEYLGTLDEPAVAPPINWD